MIRSTYRYFLKFYPLKMPNMNWAQWFILYKHYYAPPLLYTTVTATRRITTGTAVNIMDTVRPLLLQLLQLLLLLQYCCYWY